MKPRKERERRELTPLGSLFARERVDFEAILFLQSINMNIALILTDRTITHKHTHTHRVREIRTSLLRQYS